jgi:hypothetical protein
MDEKIQRKFQVGVFLYRTFDKNSNTLLGHDGFCSFLSGKDCSFHKSLPIC